jgi:hypothetical protein
MFNFFKSRKDETVGTKILTASLSDAFTLEMEADNTAYKRPYHSVHSELFTDARSLLGALKTANVLHLFGNVDKTGIISTARGEQFTGANLLTECVNSNVKAVIIAIANDADAYVQGVPQPG